MLYPAELQPHYMSWPFTAIALVRHLRSRGDSVSVAYLTYAPPTRLHPLSAASLPPLPPSGRRGFRFESPVLSKVRNQRQNCHHLRSRGDSNPRYPFGAQLLSREPDSATLAPLQCTYLNNGAGGIRTPGTLAGSTVFKTASLNRSDTAPERLLNISKTCFAVKGMTYRETTAY